MGFCGQRMPGKWDAFKRVMTGVQGMRVPVRLKGNAGGHQEDWMTRDIETLVIKQIAMWQCCGRVISGTIDQRVSLQHGHGQVIYARM